MQFKWFRRQKQKGMIVNLNLIINNLKTIEWKPIHLILHHKTNMNEVPIDFDSWMSMQYHSYLPLISLYVIKSRFLITLQERPFQMTSIALMPYYIRLDHNNYLWVFFKNFIEKKIKKCNISKQTFEWHSRKNLEKVFSIQTTSFLFAVAFKKIFLKKIKVKVFFSFVR